MNHHQDIEKMILSGVDHRWIFNEIQNKGKLHIQGKNNRLIYKSVFY